MSRMCGHRVAILALLVLAYAVTASAQVTAGDASMNLNGSISTGYSGSFGNAGPSSHGIGFGGVADLSGFYHSSQFLTFDVSPFYNQSRNNSSYRSITDSTGLTARFNIFGGSKYPGYVNYSDVYNSEGTFFLPGTADFKTNGNSRSFGVGWSGRPTDTFSFSAGYQNSSNNSSVYGTNNRIQSHFHSLFATSTYTLDGFRLTGGIRHSNGNYSFPENLAGQTSQTSRVDTTTYNFSLSRGFARYATSTWSNFSRNTTGYDAMGTKDSATNDVLTGGVTLKPAKKLSLSATADYDDNLAATVYQAENSAGIAPLVLPPEKSHSWGVYGHAQYSPAEHFSLTGDVTHRQQLFLGTSFGATAYSGGMNYGHELFGGNFTGGAVVTRSELGISGGSLVALWSRAMYSRRIGPWNVNGSFGYSRHVETLLIGYTSSGYSYSTSVSRRFGKLSWSGTAGGSKSLFAQGDGTTTLTQTYSTSLAYQWFAVGGGYSKSSGLGLYTPQGIATPPTVPPTILPSPVLYGGRTYSVSVAATPVGGLIFSGSFVTTRSNTESELLSSNNRIQQANVYLQYRFRKVFFTAGYSRLLQGFSASTLAPAVVSAYYFGISRWFKVF
jgi:hypothetical protein